MILKPSTNGVSYADAFLEGGVGGLAHCTTTFKATMADTMIA